MANRKNYTYNIAGTMTSITTGSRTTVPDCLEGYRQAADYSRKKPVASFLPPTNYDLDEYALQRFNGALYKSDKSQGWTGYIDGIPNPLSCLVTDQASCPTIAGKIGGTGRPQYDSNLTNRTLNKLRNKIKDQQVNLGIAYAERSQTAGLIGGTCMRIYRAARDIRHGRFAQGLKHLNVIKKPKDFSSAVLAFNFGVRPLCQDVYGAVNKLDQLSRDDWMVTVKAKSTARHEFAKEFQRGLYDSYTLTGTLVQGAFARADVVPANQSLITAASLGLTNPALIAWELVPFSFVVDWFWPLGDYMSTWDAMAGWDVRGYSMTELSKVRSRYVGRSGTYSGQSWINTTQAFYDRVRISRTASTSSVPFSNIPALKNPVSQQHALNALALLGQFFGRSR